jgi:RNA-directed DNA polymerase
MVSKEAFYDLDGVLFRALWKWARRRHPMKSRQWTKDRYWVRNGTRDWIFSSGETTLITAGYTKIERHRLIKLDKIPFLKEDEEYFIGRKADRKNRKKAAVSREASLR